MHSRCRLLEGWLDWMRGGSPRTDRRWARAAFQRGNNRLRPSKVSGPACPLPLLGLTGHSACQPVSALLLLPLWRWSLGLWNLSWFCFVSTFKVVFPLQCSQDAIFGSVSGHSRCGTTSCRLYKYWWISFFFWLQEDSCRVLQCTRRLSPQRNEHIPQPFRSNVNKTINNLEMFLLQVPKLDKINTSPQRTNTLAG